MITDTTKLCDMFGPSSRRDQVLRLLKLGLEADDDGVALNLEAWSGVASDIDIVRDQTPPWQKASGQEGAPRARKCRYAGSLIVF